MLFEAKNPWGVDLWILRSDQSEQHLGGNKFHKLIGYVERARRESQNHLVTVAGAHSNHLRAFAALLRRERLSGTAIIRGEELTDPARHSDAIQFALACGVRCTFVSRANYRALRERSTIEEIARLAPQAEIRNAIFIPEGGLGPDGLTGVMQWAHSAAQFGNIVIACATGNTCAGFLRATPTSSRIMGVAVLRNAASVLRNIETLAPDAGSRFTLNENYVTKKFGTAEQIAPDLIDAGRANNLHVDPIYTAKVLAAIRDMAAREINPGRILMVYTYNE